MNAVATMQEYRKNLITKRTLYKRVFDTDPGHRVLKDLRKFCKIGQDILVPGDPHATAHNIGCQRVYLRIESILKMDADTIDAISRDRT
jgi:hypothetical protein